MLVVFFFICVVDVYVFFFFFQAEDGIRDGTVTGVQTCALPISGKLLSPAKRRKGIQLACEKLKVSQRRACRAFGQPRSTQRYTPQVRSDEPPLVKRMVELACMY